MARFGEGLTLTGIVMVLFGLVQTGRMLGEDYHGPLPAMVKGFSPILAGPQGGSAPPLSSRPLSSARPRAAALASPPEHHTAAGNSALLVPTGSAPPSAAPPPTLTATDSAPAAQAGGQAQDAHQTQAAIDEQSLPAATATEAAPAVPDWLDIPVIELSAPIVAVEAEQVRVSGLDLQQWSAPNLFAAGWHSSSALLGQPGNTVLNGHHNIDGSVFARLHDLKSGDEIVVWSQSRAFFYEVDQVMLLEERYAGLTRRMENARWILHSDDERLTLVTCWPPESNTHRVVVVARRIP
jgi:LPXTG-site transpeptidase (sortase) family protein